MNRASYSQFHPIAPIGKGDTFPLGRGRFANLKVELGLEPPSPYVHVNTKVEESYRDERREELQH